MKCPSCGEDVKVYAVLTINGPHGTHRASAPICVHCLCSGIGLQKLIAWTIEYMAEPEHPLSHFDRQSAKPE